MDCKSTLHMKQIFKPLLLTLFLVTLNSCAQNKDISGMETQAYTFFSFIEKNDIDSAWDMINVYTRERNEFNFDRIVDISSFITKEQISGIKSELDSTLNLHISKVVVHCSKRDYLVTLYFYRNPDNSFVINSLGCERIFGEMKPSDGMPEPIKSH